MATAVRSGGIARGPITVSIMLATTMYAIDGTIANVALPHMQGGLSAGSDQITWVLTSFIVAQALATPLVGWVADRIGRKRLLLISIASFTTASAACGLALNLEQMILFRVIQGFAGAAFVPLSQTILFDINPPEKHAQAMSIFGAGVVLGPILGPFLGGLLTETLNWRWVFLVNLPVGVLAFLGVMTFLPERRPTDQRAFDFMGFGSLAVFIVTLQLMFDRGPGEDWFQSLEIQLYAILAASGLYMFIFHTLTAPKPFFDRTLLGNRNFLTGCLVGFLTGVLMFATLALLPPLMQNLLGYPVITAGVVTMPRGIGMFISMIVVGRAMSRFDPRALLAFGFIVNAVALWQMTLFNLEMDSTLVIVSGVIQGFGLGFIFVPSNTLAFATLPASMRTDGSAIFTLVRSIGSAVGISVMQALFVNNMQTSYSDLIQNIRPDNPNLPLATQGMEALSAWAPEVARQAAMVSYVSDFYLAMLLTLAALPLVLLMKRPKTAPATKETTHVMD